jgi:Flp pilus assembly protein TadD
MLELLLATMISVTDAPATKSATLNSAYAELKRGDLAQARVDFRKELQRRNFDPAALAQLFYVDRRLHRDSEAIAFGQRYLALRPNDDRFHLNFAYALAAAKDPHAAAAFNKLATSSDTTVAQAAKAQLATLPAATPPQDPLLANAYGKLKTGDSAGAISFFQQYLAGHPQDAPTLLQLGYTQAAAGDPAGSLSSLDRYLALRPDDLKAQLQRAYDLQATQQVPAALDLFAKLAGCSDPDVAAHARTALAQAAASDPLVPSAYKKLQSGDRAGAVADMQQHLVRFPDDAPVWLNLAYAQADSGNRAASLDSVHRYLALQPDDPKAELEEAYDLDALGRHSEAHTLYQKLSTSTDPTVSSPARAQLHAFDETNKPVTPAAEAWVEYDSRFKDTFYGGEAYARLTRPQVQPYAVFRFSNDTRSTNGPVPTIYNDNAAVVGLGLRKSIIPGAFVYVEGGGHFKFDGTSSVPALRIGLNYYHLFGPQGGSNTSLGFDASHYSYYAGDTIAYGQLLHVAPLNRQFGFIFGTNLGFDTQNLYYNNYAEALGGVQLSFSSFRLRLSEVYGLYYRGLSMPPSHSYWSTRPMFVYDVRF